MLSAIGLLLFMAMFIKCCAVHTPSSNPKKAPALKLTDTLRRPADTLRRKVGIYFYNKSPLFRLLNTCVYLAII